MTGLDVAAEPLRVRRISAVVGQEPAVDRALPLPGRRNLEIHARLWGARRAWPRVAEVTDALGLGEIIDRPVSSWFTAVSLAPATYGIAEILANRIGEEEEYVNMIPTIGIAPWLFAGSLMRYGLADPGRAALRAIWGLTDVTVRASLSLTVPADCAIGLTWLAVHVFTRTAVR